MFQKYFKIVVALSLFTGAQAQKQQRLVIDTLLSQKISIRALEIDGDKIWYAGDHNQLGYYDTKTKKKSEIRIQADSLKLEFRSLAQNTQSVFVANIGNPAFIFKVDKNTLKVEKVYSEYNEKVFYDSLKFWNEKEGIAVGDPTSTCLSIVITRDGGNSWEKLGCNLLPPVADGEAAFAASNTNICIRGNRTWIVSGGKKARVFFSFDKGKSWSAYATPIVQGEAMTGIFTADFYDNQTGIIAGGNYEAPNQNTQNKALSRDGGKTWSLLAEGLGFGYASCIQFVPKTKGQAIVAVGTMGLYYSSDQGTTWEQRSTDNTLFTIRSVNKKTAFAAGKNKLIRIVFK